jgi:3-oxoacyl-[acyl-carrier protein] reductase
MSLSGKKVLVTGVGAENGIGYACAKSFVDAGAAVFVTSMSARASERAKVLGANVAALCGDLTDPKFASLLVQTAITHLGGLDVLVNNAGMTSVAEPMELTGESSGIGEISQVAWRSALARNLDSVFYITQAALPALRESGFGRVIAISSVTGPVMAMRNEAAYAAAKSGVVGLIRSIAVDEGKFGITANAVSPGWIATDSQTQNEMQQGKHTPIGRSGTPAEIASAVVWLASDSASYITGQNIVIDGGNSIAEERA